jgi:hypothetical protein
MEGEEEVLVALDQLFAAILIKIDPSFKQLFYSPYKYLIDSSNRLVPTVHRLN